MTQADVAKIHDEWVSRYLSTVDKRFKATNSPDAHMYNVDLDANGAELDEFFDAVDRVDSVSIAGAFGFQVTNVVTAAGKHHINTPDPNWDESKVKRDSEGKFAKKVGVKAPSVEKLTPIGTGQVEIHGKPIYINTNVIYKQTYADGAVVAEQPLTNKRLRWDGKKKKFLLQKRHPAGHWETKATYGKGEAYKQLSKETGWFEPTTTTPAVPKKAMSSALATKKIQDMTTAEFDAWFAKKFPTKDEWDLAGTLVQGKVYEKAYHSWNTDPEGGEPFAQLKKWGYKPPIVVKEMTEVTATAPSTSMTSPKYIDDLMAAAKFANVGYVVAKTKMKTGADARVVKTLKDEYTIQVNIKNGWTGVTGLNEGELKQYFGYQTDTWTPVINVPATPSAPGVGVIPDFTSDVDESNFVSWITKLTPEEWNQLTPDQQTTLHDHFMDINSAGLLSERQMNKYQSMIKKANHLSDLAKVQIGYAVDDEGDSESELITKLDKMDPGQFLTWFNENVKSKEDFDAYSNSMKDHLKTLAQGTKDFFGIHGPAIAIEQYEKSEPTVPNVSLPEIAFLKHMSSDQFESWFDDNIDESIWNQLSDSEKNKLKQLAKKSSDDAYTIPLSKINKWDLNKTYASSTVMDPDQVLKTINGMSTGAIDVWFDNNNFTKSDWDQLSQTQKNNIFHAVESKHAPLAKDYLKSWEIKDLTPNDLSGLNYGEVQQLETHIKDLTAKGFLSNQDALHYLQVKKTAATLAAVGTPSPTTVTPTVSPPTAVTGSKYFVDVHSQITPIADIGTPSDTGPNTKFNVIPPHTAVAMQQHMLNIHGKTITPEQTAAVQRYTTSVGYRSTNAVLRDDATQMKKLTASDLQAGVKNAVNLQSAMSPITSNVRVFRGTGAHAFGQKGIHANFTQLKKLEGKTLTDKGFMSTTVLEQPPVTYDYAKKPIQMIVDVPAGSPATYVSAITPGWSTENELILAAGSTYRIKEVREATELDKKQFGNPTLEHVVHVEIVPGTGNPSHKITTPTDIGKTPKPTTTAGTGTANLALVTPSVATKPTIGPIKASDLQLPMKLTTTVIHKNKYQHGAVVAYRKNVDGSLSRIFWNAHTKKFVLQNQNASTGMWSNFAGYGKGEAYSQFGKDTNWFAPPPGDSAFGADFQAAVNAPTISNPLPTPSAPTPATSTAPTTKIDAATLQAMHGDISVLTPEKKDSVYNDFKKGLGYNTHLGTSPEFIFDKMLKVQKKHTLNLLQILRIVDEKSTPAGATNEHKYEQKIVDWLKTPDGKTSALDLLNAPEPLPGALPKGAVVSPTGEISHAIAPHSPAIQAVLDKIKKPSDIGTTDLSDTTFSPMTPAQAKAMNAKLQAVNPWTPTQKSALTTYTGQEFQQMNGVLRNDPKHISYLSEETKVKYAKLSKNAQDGMRPLPKSVTVYRKTGTKQLPGLGENAKFEDVLAFEGKTFIDRGFFSSSVTDGVWSGNLWMTLEVAKGVPAAWVKQISKNPQEDELLLAAGLKYRVISVEKGFGSVIKMRLRVEV